MPSGLMETRAFLAVTLGIVPIVRRWKLLETEVNQALWFTFASCLGLEVGSWLFPDASWPTSGALGSTAQAGGPASGPGHHPQLTSVLLEGSVEANPHAPRFLVLGVGIQHISPPASDHSHASIHPVAGQNLCLPHLTASYHPLRLSGPLPLHPHSFFSFYTRSMDLPWGSH